MSFWISRPFEEWFENVALGALSSKETLKMTYDMALRQVERRIPGDFVECGVFGGAQCAMLARAASFGKKRVHMFDSFEGDRKSVV